MQNLNTTAAPLAALVIATGDNTDAGDVTPILAVPTAPVADKPAKPKRAAKPVAAKPAAPAAIVPPVADDTGRAAERIAARDAVASYYSGRSLPFKAASDTFAAIRTDKAPKAATTRQAALLAAMLVSGDNVKANGRFTRGGFLFDGKAVQPETGCLSDMLGRVVTYVSGPLTGKQARDAIFSIDLKRARTEISAHLGDKLGKAALAKLDKLAPVKAAKPAKAA